ncbi:MAG: hypothetical protein EBR86_13825 [Planctomycetia bacterium]|nr:hypothetical protein [Planctomycetia bacterium]
MVKRRLHGFVGMSLAVSLTGCTIPANSPLTGLAQIRPVATPHTNVLPPAAMLHHPGPGVEGPGPGVIAPASYEMALDAAAAEAGMAGGGGLPGANLPVSQIGFIGPDGMHVRWDVSALGGFDSTPLVTPGRYDFAQGGIYRLKITDIPGRAGLELYPTLEVAPVTPRTDAFLAHNAVPFQLTEEDLDQVTTGNFVTKVVYLPDPDYQELAVAGVETLVSTRLDPGCDPVVEADRRGSILAIIRIGNKDLESGGPAGSGGVAGGAPVGAGGGPGGTALPLGVPCGGNAGLVPPAFMAGMTAPQYGLPYTGTPIGLPGPAHIPLGIPAGLQKHTITNHTKMHIPPPTRELKLHVQQYPGLSYPKPAHRAYIAERSDVPNIRLRQPVEERTRYSDNGGPDADTAAGECPPAPENYLP